MGTGPFPGDALTLVFWNLFVASWNALVDALSVGDPSKSRFFTGAPSVAAVAVSRTCQEHALSCDSNIEFARDVGSEILPDGDHAPSEFASVSEHEHMAAFLRGAASGPMTAGSPLRNFAVALLSALRKLMRDADVPRLTAGVYRPSNNQSYWAANPGFTVFKVLDRVGEATTSVHTCVVMLPDAMANIRTTYSNESVFAHVTYALKAFDSGELDLHGVLKQMNDHHFDSYGMFMFSANEENPEGLVALSSDDKQCVEASASSEAAPRPPMLQGRPTESAAQLSGRRIWCYSDGPSTLMPFLVRIPPLHLGVCVRPPCEPWRFVRAAFVFVVAGVSHLPRGDARAVLPALGAPYRVRHRAEGVVY